MDFCFSYVYVFLFSCDFLVVISLYCEILLCSGCVWNGLFYFGYFFGQLQFIVQCLSLVVYECLDWQVYLMFSVFYVFKGELCLEICDGVQSMWVLEGEVVGCLMNIIYCLIVGVELVEVLLFYVGVEGMLVGFGECGEMFDV